MYSTRKCQVSDCRRQQQWSISTLSAGRLHGSEVLEDRTEPGVQLQGETVGFREPDATTEADRALTHLQ